MRDRPNEPTEARMRQTRSFHAVISCIAQKVKGYLKTGVARVQRGPCILVTRREVIRHDNLGGSSGITDSRFHRNGRLDQLHAGAGVLDQGYEFRNDRILSVVSIVGSGRKSAALCAPHEYSPRLRF